MTDEELADLIHELNNELNQRCRIQRPDESWLKRQLRISALSVRSWSSQHQKNMKGTFS
jgi:hypothetical protein